MLYLSSEKKKIPPLKTKLFLYKKEVNSFIIQMNKFCDDNKKPTLKWRWVNQKVHKKKTSSTIRVTRYRFIVRIVMAVISPYYLDNQSNSQSRNIKTGSASPHPNPAIKDRSFITPISLVLGFTTRRVRNISR